MAEPERNQIWSDLTSGDASAIASVLETFGDLVVLNSGRGSLQVKGCSGEMIAYNIPIAESVLKALAE